MKKLPQCGATYIIRHDLKKIMNPGPEGQALTSPQLPARRAYSLERGVVLAVT